jgi:hypothetical protein
MRILRKKGYRMFWSCSDFIKKKMERSRRPFYFFIYIYFRILSFFHSEWIIQIRLGKE